MLAMFRGHGRQAQKFFPIHNHFLSVGSTEGAAAEAAATVADFFPRYTKNEATPPNTPPMTASRLKMPRFMPLAIGESDWPAHAAQAQSEPGFDAKATTKPHSNGRN